jgi:FkbM family methyltransferase
MTPSQLAAYYVSNNSEFREEHGHNKLLVGLKALLPKEPAGTCVVGIDVGTCIGDYLDNISAICSEQESKILCFEPNPVNIAVAEPKINAMKNATLFTHCLSNDTYESGFYNWVHSNTNLANNGIAGLKSGGAKICDVKVKKLDDVLDSVFPNDDIIIKFIKIDTEGHDGNVLKGMERHLPVTKYIIFECSDCLDDHRGPGIKNPMKNIVDFLSKNGFDTYRIGTRKMFKVNDEYWNQIYDDYKFWSNCFAIKKGDPVINLLVDENFNYKF